MILLEERDCAVFVRAKELDHDRALDRALTHYAPSERALRGLERCVDFWEFCQQVWSREVLTHLLSPVERDRWRRRGQLGWLYQEVWDRFRRRSLRRGALSNIVDAHQQRAA